MRRWITLHFREVRVSGCFGVRLGLGLPLHSVAAHEALQGEAGRVSVVVLCARLLGSQPGALQQGRVAGRVHRHLLQGTCYDH